MVRPAGFEPVIYGFFCSCNASELIFSGGHLANGPPMVKTLTNLTLYLQLLRTTKLLVCRLKNSDNDNFVK